MYTEKLSRLSPRVDRRRRSAHHTIVLVNGKLQSTAKNKK